MKKIFFAMVLVLLAGGLVSSCGAEEKTPEKKKDAEAPAPAQVVKDADAPQVPAPVVQPKADVAAPVPPSPALKKVQEELDKENAALDKAKDGLIQALKKEAEALEEAKKLNELDAQKQFVKKLREQAEYQARESERRAKRALNPEPEPAPAPSVGKSDADKILELIRARQR